MGLHDLVMAHLEETGDDIELLAMAVLEDLMNDREALDAVVLPALRHEIRRYLRVLTLQTEKDSIVGKPPADPAADRMAFLNERFFVPGIGFITWAEATVAHHEARIAYLNTKIYGIQETANRHLEAIKQIEAAGAKTLGEVHKPRRVRKSA